MGKDGTNKRLGWWTTEPAAHHVLCMHLLGLLNFVHLQNHLLHFSAQFSPQTIYPPPGLCSSAPFLLCPQPVSARNFLQQFGGPTRYLLLFLLRIRLLLSLLPVLVLLRRQPAASTASPAAPARDGMGSCGRPSPERGRRLPCVASASAIATLVALPLTERSLTLPLGGSRSVFSHGGRPLKGTKTSHPKLCNLVEPWVVVVVRTWNLTHVSVDTRQ